MIELGYLVFDDEKSCNDTKDRVHEVFVKLGYSNDIVSGLMSTIAQIFSILLLEEQQRGVYISILTEHTHQVFSCRIDNILNELDFSQINSSFDSMEQMIDEKKQYTIFLKEMLSNEITSIQEAMNLRKILSVSVDSKLQKELESAKKKLTGQKNLVENSNQLKLDFLSNISHEIRTPMNAIMGMTYLLEKTTLDEVQKGYLEKTKSACKRLLGMMNEVLDLSKIKSETGRMQNIAFHKMFIAESVFQMLLKSCENEAIKMSLEVDEGIPDYLYADPFKIIELLRHYVNNAVKFTEKGSISVSVKLQSKSQDKCLVQFDIQDTGIGLKEEEKNKLFLSMRQMEPSITKQYEGIGLVIARELAQQLQGKIGVYSKEGSGSTFWFAMNCAIPAVRKVDKAEVLLVEDNALNQMIAIALLKEKGLGADIAKNGKEAVEYVRKKQYDLILMDLQMPVLNGLEATNQIRKLEKYKEIPIIAMTANVQEEDKNKCFLVGMNDYLTKPIEPEEFFFVLLKWLPESPEKDQILKQMQKSNMEIHLEELKNDIQMNENSIVFPNNSEKGRETKDQKEIMGAKEKSDTETILDMRGSLNRMMGNENLYHSLILKFYEEQMTFSEEIKKLLSLDQLETAVRFTHTFKGMAGTIGAIQLQKTAEELEKELEVISKGQQADKLEEVLLQIKRALDSLEKVFWQKGFVLFQETKKEKKITKTKQYKAGNKEFQMLLEELKPHIELQKPKNCKEVFKKYQEHGWEAAEEKKVEEISSYVNKYKFREALTLIDEALMKS